MQLIILGKNSDDKGTQLEKLTMKLLTKLGYKNSELSHIGSGGLEIDVVATFEMPTIGGVEPHRTLIECKAHSNPISTTDWLKFIGKVSVEEIKRGANVHGCLLALNGANGNARGIYEDIRERKKNIRLLSGQDLRNALSDAYSICSQDIIELNVCKLTSRKPLNYILCYYEDAFVWSVQFDADKFCAFDSQGELINTTEGIVDLIKQNTSSGESIDLLSEREAIFRHKNVVSLVLSSLLLNPEGIDIQDIAKFIESGKVSIAQQTVGRNEITSALDELSAEKILNLENNTAVLPTPLTLSFYQKILGNTVYVSAFSSDVYISGINLDLLNEICALQGNLKLSAEAKEKALFFLTRSPSAMARAIKPDPMLTNGLAEFEELTSNLLEHAEQHFLSSIYDGFAIDYRQPTLSEYFHNKLGLVEIEKKSEIKIKSTRTIALELELKQRHAIAQVCESLGGGLLHLSLLNDTKEPWEYLSDEKK